MNIEAARKTVGAQRGQESRGRIWKAMRETPQICSVDKLLKLKITVGAGAHESSKRVEKRRQGFGLLVFSGDFSFVLGAKGEADAG